MKLARLTTLYPLYAKKFYAQHTTLHAADYAAQLGALHHDAFGWADFWSHALTAYGYEGLEIVANAKPLQAAWAREHDVPMPASGWLHAIAHEQIRRARPDVLFVDDFTTFEAGWLHALRRDCPSIRMVIGWCGAPYSDLDFIRGYDVLLSCIPDFVARLREAGHPAQHVNHAFEPRILERLDTANGRPLDFSFVGQISGGRNAHGERERLLRVLAGRTSLRIFSPEGDTDYPKELKFLAGRGVYASYKLLERAGVPRTAIAAVPLLGKATRWPGPPPVTLFSKPVRGIRPSVFGLRMFQTLRDSRVTLNCHIDMSKGSASNMRLYEATGVGTCLLTDRKPNLHELFEPDREVVTYGSADECIEKVKWLLDHPRERETIARAGQARTLRDHTFAVRAARLDEIIRTFLARKTDAVASR